MLTILQGVRAVIAESFERIHRSNLVGMGIIPLQFVEGETVETLGITGKELFSVEVPQDLKLGQNLTVKVRCKKLRNVGKSKGDFCYHVEIVSIRTCTPPREL